MKEYKIAEGSTPDDLTDVVNSAIDDGWDLQGGVCYRQTKAIGNKKFFQALVKVSKGQRRKKVTLEIDGDVGINTYTPDETPE